MAINTGKIIGAAKKNIFTIVCALIAIGAIVATYWPLGGMIESLKGEADTRASLYGTLDGLVTQSRKLPLTDPSKTTPDDLTTFPNKETLEKGQAATKDVSDQSLKMVKLIDDLNAAPHAPLVDQVLPNGTSPVQKYKFGDIYKLVMSLLPDDSIKTNQKLIDAKQPNLRNDILNAGIPPSALDITNAQTALWNDKYSQRVIYRNGTATNEAEVRAQSNTEAAQLPEKMRMDVATTKKVYVAPDAFTVNDAVTGQREPVLTDIWFSQLTLWIQQDISRAIAQANGDAKNILDAPVKHLIKLSIPMNPSPYFGLTLTAPGAPATTPPIPATGGDIVPLTKNINASPTGRVSNAMYDVVQFTLVVNIDASQIPKFIQTLSKNRLIDVYNVNFISVDLAEARQSGYIYGTAPVVRLTLSCEALFMRAWTVPLMPHEVQALLNIAPATPPAGAAGAQASAQ